MRLPEWHSLAHEIIGKISCVREVLFDRTPHHVLAYLHPADEPGIDGEAELHRVDRVEQSLFVLLQILVVGEWQSLDSGERRHEVTDDAPRLAAHELRDVGVFLLRHHGRSRAVRVV